MGYRVAVAGATGNVGREMLDILAEREFPGRRGRRRSPRRARTGDEVDFGDDRQDAQGPEHRALRFRGRRHLPDVAGGSEVSKEWSPKIAAAGCIVIDNSSACRMDPDVPLIVPEVNADAIDGLSPRRTSSPTRTARPRSWWWR